MKTSTQRTSVIICGVLTASSLVHAQPPDIVQSDISGNTAMGTNALAAQPTGSLGEFNNTAAGISALKSNTGYDNTAFGAGALESSNSIANTAVGIGSMVITTTGHDNTGVGAYTLWHNTTGSGNTAAGLNALVFNETGENNTAVGTNSLDANTSGSTNVASENGTRFFC
jgi:trimeric autotransporter adhesin